MMSRLILAGLSLAVCSCASVGVRSTQLLSDEPPRKVPAAIFVKPLAYYDPNVAVDRSGTKLSDFQYDFQEKFTRFLTSRLSDGIAPASAMAATAPPRRGNYWLITGQFDRVSQGSRFLRSFAGFGLGGTKLDATVVVSDMSGPTPRPFLVIRTSGGSNALPLVLGFPRSGLTFDAQRTAREVTAAISEFLYQQGAVPYEYAVAPRRLSETAPARYDPRAWVHPPAP